MTKVIELQNIKLKDINQYHLKLDTNPTTIAFNNKGTIVVGFNDGHLQYYSDTFSKGKTCSVKTSNSVIYALKEFENNFIVSGDSGIVEIYSLNNLIDKTELDGSWIEFIATSKQRNIFVVVSARTGIINNMGKISKIKMQGGAPTGISIDSWKSEILISDKIGIHRWCQNGKFIYSHLTRGSLKGLAVSPSGRYICSALQEGDIYCWQPANNSEVMLAAEEHPYQDYKWSVDGCWFAVLSKSVVNLFVNNYFGLNQQPTFSFKISDGFYFKKISWNPIFNTFCITDTVGRIWLVSISNCETNRLIINQLRIDVKSPEIISWSPNGDKLYLSSNELVSEISPN